MAKALKTCPCCGGEAVVDRVGYRYSDTGDHAMAARHEYHVRTYPSKRRTA